MKLNKRLILKVAALLCILFVLYRIFDREPKVSKFILYSPLTGAIDMMDVSFEQLNLHPHKEVTDRNSLRLFRKTRRYNTLFRLWKGHTYGAVIYKNGDSAIIRISRYGGFYLNLKNKKAYTFWSQKDKDNWMSMI